MMNFNYLKVIMAETTIEAKQKALNERQEKLLKQVAEIKKASARLEAKKKTEARKIEDQRKYIAGSIWLAESMKSDEAKQKFYAFLEPRLTTPAHRELFGFAPVKPNETT